MSQEQTTYELIGGAEKLRELVDRDMKLLYKRSALGIAWTLINPLLQLAVFSFVFKIVIPVNIPQFSSFAFSGLLIWTWTQTALFQATALITGNRALIRQPNFPYHELHQTYPFLDAKFPIRNRHNS